jgi:hypothetical protein
MLIGRHRTGIPSRHSTRRRSEIARAGRHQYRHCWNSGAFGRPLIPEEIITLARQLNKGTDNSASAWVARNAAA